MAGSTAMLLALLAIFAATASATYCRAPASPRYGGFSPRSNFYGIRRGVRFFCNTGYVLVGRSSTVCVWNHRQRAAVWYHPTPICKRIECPILRDPQNGDVDLPRSRVPGSKATYSCNSGFDLVGDRTRKCLTNGEWEGDAPVCRRIVCPSLPDPANGDVLLPSSRVPGSKATYSCNSGFDLVGDRTRKCLTNGEWEGDAPVCRRIVCPSLPDPANGDVLLPSSRVPGSKATYSCNSGFDLVGDRTRKCLANGEWEGDAPVCRRIMCPSLPDPANGDVLLPSSRVPGSKATYSCNSGFDLAGDRTRKCLTNGEWEGDAPVCRRIECPSLRDPQNGDVDLPRSRVPGSKATYSCNSGFDLVGDRTRKCLTNGEWEGDAPVCRRIVCPSLPDPANGDVRLPSSRVPGSKATYSCNSGFDLVGDRTRKCLTNGEWEGDAPVCRRIVCPSLPDPANGDVRLPSSRVPGSKATYSCNSGFDLVGDSTRKCLANGEWEGDAPVCRRIECPSLPDPANGDVRLPSSRVPGSKATYSCNSGFDLVGDRTRKCLTNGEWEGDAPVCRKIDCGDLSDPDFGQVSLSGTAFGSTASYSCLTGYLLVGMSSRTCGADGNWSGRAPICKIVDCGDLENPDFGRVLVPSSTFGSTATYRCQERYKLKGVQTRVCQANGEWSDEAPICKFVVVDCGVLDPPAFGKVLITGTTAGSTARYSCFPTYALVGDAQRRCQQDSQWSGSEPVCKLIVCGRLDRPDNGWVHVPCSTVGCIASFGCRNGYTKIGSKTRTCTYDGSWSGSSPTCVRDYYG